MGVTGTWSALADVIDPPNGLRPELATPVTLAAHLDRTYQVRGHVTVIGEKLAALMRRDFDRLMINTPPQVGKSRTAVEWGAFWWLCVHPTTRIVVGCYGDDLAVRRGKAIRRLVERHGAAYGLHLERGSTSMKDWTLTSGGGVRSGVGFGALVVEVAEAGEGDGGGRHGGHGAHSDPRSMWSSTTGV